MTPKSIAKDAQPGENAQARKSKTDAVALDALLNAEGDQRQKSRRESQHSEGAEKSRWRHRKVSAGQQDERDQRKDDKQKQRIPFLVGHRGHQHWYQCCAPRMKQILTRQR